MSSDLQELQNSLRATLEEKRRGPWVLSRAGGAGWRARLWVPTGTADPSPGSISSEVPKTPVMPQEQVRNHIPHTTTALHPSTQTKHPKTMVCGRKQGPLPGDEPTHDHHSSPSRPWCSDTARETSLGLGISGLSLTCSRAGFLICSFFRQIPWQASSTCVHCFQKMHTPWLAKVVFGRGGSGVEPEFFNSSQQETSCRDLQGKPTCKQDFHTVSPSKGQRSLPSFNFWLQFPQDL